jgi:hypothetical protein
VNTVKSKSQFFGCGKSNLFRHSERSEESLLGFRLGKDREILRLARNDKRLGGFLPSLNPAKSQHAGSARHPGGFRLADKYVAQHQHIHVGPQKTFDGFLRAANDWFVVVE